LLPGETIEEQLRQSLEMADQRVAELERQSKLSPIFWYRQARVWFGCVCFSYVIVQTTRENATTFCDLRKQEHDVILAGRRKRLDVHCAAK
jgi:hypothetical protein